MQAEIERVEKLVAKIQKKNKASAGDDDEADADEVIAEAPTPVNGDVIADAETEDVSGAKEPIHSKS